MKTYQRHNCTRQHRTHKTLAECMFPRAAWVHGDGPYACLAWCDVLTIFLHQSEDDAGHSKDHIDDLGCGHACTRRHEIVQLIL